MGGDDRAGGVRAFERALQRGDLAFPFVLEDETREGPVADLDVLLLLRFLDCGGIPVDLLDQDPCAFRLAVFKSVDLEAVSVVGDAVERDPVFG